MKTQLHATEDVDLQPQATSTHVRWTAEVKTLGGLLKMVPAGLIRGAAQKVVNDAWTAVETKLRAPTTNG